VVAVVAVPLVHLHLLLDLQLLQEPVVVEMFVREQLVVANLAAVSLFINVIS